MNGASRGPGAIHCAMFRHRFMRQIPLFALVFCASAASAQTAPGAPSGRAGANPLPDAASSPTMPAPGEPALPEIHDPMLEPLPPPQRVLRTWQEALARIRSESTSLRTARARTAQAEAEARLALSPAVPTLTGNAGLQHHLLRGEASGFDANDQPVSWTVPDPATRLDASLNLRIPLLAARTWYEHGTAKDAVEAAELHSLETERLEIALAANTIVSTVTAERLAEVSRVSLRSALSTLELNRRRAALGASSAVDVLRAEREVSASRAQVVGADERLLRARETLGLALGSTEAWGVRSDIRLDSLANDAQASCRLETNIRARPDVRAAEAAARLAERSTRAPSYDLVPSIDGVSTLAYDSNRNQTPNGEHLTWTIGAILSWPIYDGGTRYATRAARASQAQIAREQLTLAERRATLEVTQTLRGVKTAEHNLSISRQSRDISRETARLSRVAYMNGSGTSFDLVDTARQLREAELDFAIQEFEVLRARIAALLALATCRV